MLRVGAIVVMGVCGYGNSTLGANSSRSSLTSWTGIGVTLPPECLLDTAAIWLVENRQAGV